MFPTNHHPEISCLLHFQHLRLPQKVGNHVSHLRLGPVLPQICGSVSKEEMGDQILGRQQMMSARKKSNTKEIIILAL